LSWWEIILAVNLGIFFQTLINKVFLKKLLMIELL